MRRTDLLLEAMSIFREQWEDILHEHVSTPEAKQLQDKFIVLFAKAQKEANVVRRKAAGAP